jgi:WD40 repeat protein
VLHRDIKPSNLLLDAQGTLWITDFGLAKAEGADELTQTGDIVGTVRFMAPERFEGKSLPQSDVYALGLTLYEMLTLRPAFEDANKAKLIEKVLHDAPVSPRRIDGGIPRDLETVVLKCLAKEPTERYATAEKLADDLRRFLADRPIHARRTPWRERAWRWCRRNPAWAALFAVSITLLTVIAVGGAALSISRGRALEDVREERDRVSRLREDMRSEAYLAQIRLVQREYGVGNIDLVRRLLARHVPEPGEEDLRGFEWHYWNLRTRLERRVLPGKEKYVFGLAYSPDGRLLASGEANGVIRLWDVASGTCIRELPARSVGAIVCLAFCSDGRRLAAGCGDHAVRVWEVESGRLLRTLSGHTAQVECVAYHPEGDRLATCSFDGTVRLWDLSSGRCVRTLAGHQGSVHAIAFSPDGRALAFGGWDCTLRVWDASTGRPVAAMTSPSKVLSVAFHPGGRRIASSHDDPAIRLWDRESGRNVSTLFGHADGVLAIAFSANGRRLVSGSLDSTVRLWDTDSAANLLTLHGHATPVTKVAFRPDGRQIASAGLGPAVHLWDANHHQHTLELPGHEGRVLDVAFSPDGRRIASASSDRSVRISDAADGRVLHVLRGHNSGAACVALSPDGRFAASVSEEKTAMIRDATTGAHMRTLAHECQVYSIAFSPDGRHVATAGSDGLIRIWDFARGKQLDGLTGQAGAAYCVIFSPDGRRLAAACKDRTLRLWDVASGVLLQTLEIQASATNSTFKGGFSSDGRYLAWPGSIDTARIWDLDSGRLVRTLSGHRAFSTCAVFSPDDRRLATGSIDKTIRLWDADSGQSLLTIPGNLGLIRVIVFSPDGRRLAAGGEEGLVRIWETEAVSEPVLRQRELVESRSPAALHDQARRLVTGPIGKQDPAKALELIREALRRQPDKLDFLNTLGVVQYRNGQYARAVATFESSATLRGVANPLDLYFLAMCHARLGDPAKARDCFERAGQRADSQMKNGRPGFHQAEELSRFRSEAEAALKEPTPPRR